jgi:hypothetical protein
MIMGKMGRHEMHGWMNHILGATRMLELRGEAQMDSELGRFLFETVTLLNVSLIRLGKLPEYTNMKMTRL